MRCATPRGSHAGSLSADRAPDRARIDTDVTGRGEGQRQDGFRYI